jgi:outer membrane protein insertion porin family
MFGGAVNSDAGLTGQITVDERNFDITRWPTSFRDLFSGTAFRGKGQTFRLEAVPGEQFQRYSVQFADPNLLGYLPISTNVSGFLNDRRYQDWDETRIGGRVAFGYRLTPDLSLSAGFKGQSVEFKNLRVTGIPELDQYVGQHDLFAGEFRLSHDTRNTPFGASEGHFLQWTFEQTFGDFVYPKAELDFRRYFLVRQRADGSGKHTLTMSTQFGVTGNDTPVFENFFAGGYSTLRGFEFRGASPTISGIQTGGRLSWLNSVEYMFPITADDAFRAVTFVDFGTVERDFDMNSDNFRVAPGVGLRLAIPALGPSPLAFDFAFPVADAAGDERQVFSFYMSAAR